jgi:CspA family cold shock protein
MFRLALPRCELPTLGAASFESLNLRKAADTEAIASLTALCSKRKKKLQVFGLPCRAPDFGPIKSSSKTRISTVSCAMRMSYPSSQRKEAAMATGTVKWFNPTKGYGFIQPQGGGKDVFVHISAVERAGLSTLNEGQTIQYEVVSNRGKESAENLKVS